jgi:structure-specific endonuclease subunit SLX1
MPHFCYLLSSDNPQWPNSTYIGYTTDPRHRLRQHNGELAGGAKRTHGKRPWHMVLWIGGFSSHVSALQFEWAWQHPTRTRFLRKEPRRAWARQYTVQQKIVYMIKLLSHPHWRAQHLSVKQISLTASR